MRVTVARCLKSHSETHYCSQMYRYYVWAPHSLFFFFNDTATTEIYTLSLHDALPISGRARACRPPPGRWSAPRAPRSEEHTSELQSLRHLVCRLLLEKKKEY